MSAGRFVAKAATAGTVVLALLAVQPVLGQVRTVEIVIEQLQKDRWIPVDPRTVFAHGDEIRFRAQSDFSGFLYVVNRTPSSEQRWLFPTVEAGTDNAIAAGQSYTVPATDGSFQIPEKPGYDVVFWIVSPVPLNGLTGLPPPERRLSPLLPRCHGTLLPCLDSKAGAHPAKQAEILAVPLRARDLTFDRMNPSMKIRVSSKDPGALIYEIRIAHR